MTAIFIGTKVSIQSAAKGAAKAITGVTKAAPAVVTCTAHGYVNGDIVETESDSMGDINKKIWRVANSTVNTFELEGSDSTTYDTLVTGNAYRLPGFTLFTNVTGFTPSGGDPDSIDLTSLSDTVKKSTFGLINATQWKITTRFQPNAAANALAQKAFQNNTENAYLLQFSDGQKVYIWATTSSPQQPNGSTGQLASQDITAFAQSTSTYYLT